MEALEAAQANVKRLIAIAEDLRQDRADLIRALRTIHDSAIWEGGRTLITATALDDARTTLRQMEVL